MSKETNPPRGDTAQRDQALDRALAQIEKAFGKGAHHEYGWQHHPQHRRHPHRRSSHSTSPSAAKASPAAASSKSSAQNPPGKTTLCLHIIAEAQKKGGVAAFVDADHALDPSWAKRLGVSLKDLLVSQPDTGEQALEIVETLIRSNAVDVIVVDSVAALIPKSEIEGEMGDATMGAQARLMSQAMRKLTAAVAKSKCLVIFINQIRMKIGVMFGNPETTTGGNALKFYSSVRVDIRRINAIKEAEVNIGNHVRAKVVKNKIAPPFREAEFDILFDSGISYEGDLLDMGVNESIVDKSGAWFNYGQVRLGQGREQSRHFLKENPEVGKEIREKVLAKKNRESAPEPTKPEPKAAAKPEPKPEPKSEKVTAKAGK